MTTLEGKVALVTGAGQGIGQGICYALADLGAAISAVGRTEEKLITTCAEIERRGGTAIPVVCDVTDPEQVDRAVETTVAQLGAIDILVNNAQEFAFGPLLGVDLDTVEKGWSSGPLATLRLMRACYPHLKNGGVVLNLASGITTAPNPSGAGAYAAAKAAVQALSRAAAVEWAGDGIRVNTLMPVARTPAMQASFDAHPGLEDQFVARLPLGRIGDAEADVGSAAAFLCGPGASYITGTTLAVDGGDGYVR